MSRTKWALFIVAYVILQPGTCGQQSASQESAKDHINRGTELANSRKWREAVGEFRAAIRLDPSNADAHWGLAKALDAKTDETFPLWSGAVMKEALKEYQSALRLDPKLRDDKTESAERHFQNAIGSLGPDFGRWYSQWCGDFSDNWVNHCMDNAVAELRIALLLDPDYFPAHLGLGVILSKLHKTDAAIEEFRAALRLDPHSAEAHLGLGKSLEKKGKLEDALQEYAGALSLPEGRTKYEKLFAKLGIKKQQPPELGAENNAEDHPPDHQPLYAPAKASDSAPESKMLANEQEPVSRKDDPEDMLRGFKFYYIKSDTVYLHPDTLLKELQNRREFSAWELTATEDSKAADVVITITLPFLTWEWNYRMVYQPTGTVLGTGKVSAAVEKTAAPQLAAMITKRIRDVRALPASFQETGEMPEALASSGRETGMSWRVKYLSGSMTAIPKDSSVRITVNHEWISVRASKTASFFVPAPKVATVAFGAQVRKASKGWEEFWDTTFYTVGGGDGGGAVLLIPAIPIALLGEGIFAPMKSTQHFVTIYWLEDGAMKSAEFTVGADDTKSLLAELNKATGKNIVDVQESIKKRKEWIAREYYRSPIVKIEKRVNVGWGDLAPGEYRLLLVPSEPGFAEIYFYPAKRSSFDVDLVIQAVAEFERRRTRLEGRVAPSVSYREQNGIVMLNQIETRELILRFTPIPLGFAN